MAYVETSGNSYCPDCADDHICMCDNCATDHDMEDITYLDGDNLCPVCADERQEELDREEQEALEMAEMDEELILQADE